MSYSTIFFYKVKKFVRTQYIRGKYRARIVRMGYYYLSIYLYTICTHIIKYIAIFIYNNYSRIQILLKNRK